MARSLSDGTGNAVLDSVPTHERRRVERLLRPVTLEFGATLQVAGGATQSVWFPTSGMISIVTTMSDGAIVETGVVGKESFAGVEAFLGAESAFLSSIVQQPGSALVMNATAFRAESERAPALRQAALRGTMLFLRQVTQTAACNARHPVDQRCARWLLMTRDRAGSDSFPMTQEFLAMMLGARRAGVSAAAAALRKAGVIRYRRGRVDILNTAALEHASCECYAAILQPVPQPKRSARRKK